MLMGFASAQAAGGCVAAIIGSGIVPVAIEYMDGPAIKACEAFAHAGYPLDVEALLIVEVEGSEAEIADLIGRINAVAEAFSPQVVRVSKSEAESAAIWKGRKAAFGAMGQISDYLCMDGVIPTGRLPEVLTRVGEICAGYGLAVSNIFHAGDGNLHPLILYDANKPGDIEKAEAAGADVLKLCVEVGGCLTGEHGVGIEKRDLMTVQFSAVDLAQQMRVKSVFDPGWLLEPGQGVPARRKAGTARRLPPSRLILRPHPEVLAEGEPRRIGLMVRGARSRSHLTMRMCDACVSPQVLPVDLLHLDRGEVEIVEQAGVDADPGIVEVRLARRPVGRFRIGGAAADRAEVMQHRVAVPLIGGDAVARRRQAEFLRRVIGPQRPALGAVRAGAGGDALRRRAHLELRRLAVAASLDDHGRAPVGPDGSTVARGLLTPFWQEVETSQS